MFDTKVYKVYATYLVNIVASFGGGGGGGGIVPYCPLILRLALGY